MIRSALRAGVRRILRLRRGSPPPMRPQPRPAPPPPAAPPAAPVPKAGGAPLSEEAVREVLEEMVRPALQADGGDIELVALEGRDVHVRLQGACAGCSSSQVTLRMGVEALLREEFPEMDRLVEVH